MSTPGLPWLEGRIGQAELARLCELPAAELDALVGYGALLPLPGDAAAPQFSAAWISPLREAVRLRKLHGLDLFTLSLLLGYLRRIAHLEHQLRSLQGHVAHPQPLPREGPTPWREPHA